MFTWAIDDERKIVIAMPAQLGGSTSKSVQNLHKSDSADLGEAGSILQPFSHSKSQ